MNPMLHPRGLSSLAACWSLTLLAGCGASPSAGDTLSTAAASLAVSEVREALRDYERALNQSDVDAIMRLYADDAVFMAQHREPAVGAEAIRGAYEAVFAEIDLNVAFEIDEVSMLSPTIALARTRSTGTTRVLLADAEVEEGNQELFVWVRDSVDGPWRIGRYIFSTTMPRTLGSPESTSR
ncbi:MAG: SgcJ/EcaC family oxidoreductase [Myxococcota bacterium]